MLVEAQGEMLDNIEAQVRGGAVQQRIGGRRGACAGPHANFFPSCSYGGLLLGVRAAQNGGGN